MAEPFLAEIRMVGFTFAMRGWALCEGQLLPINQNQSLFSLLGTTYGGDGRTNFGLPNLRGRTPVHPGDGINLGQAGGAEEVTLQTAHLPSHTHRLVGREAPADSVSAVGRVPAASSSKLYADEPADQAFASTAVAMAGGGQAHTNMQPTLSINFQIAMVGLFPSRN